MTRICLALALSLAASVGMAACASRSPEPAATSKAASARGGRPTPLPLLEPPVFPPLPASAKDGDEANRLATKEGRFEEALTLFRRAWEDGERRPYILYNAACTAALAAHPDEALRWLERAVEAGWRDAGHAMRDPDIAAVRDREVFTALVARMRQPNGDNEELERMSQDDQADRAAGMDIDWKVVALRDRARLVRVKELIASGAVRTANDHFSAALILQHGDTEEDYELAREHAYAAAKNGNRPALWLTAAAWDRWLVHVGYPQRFGTQFTCAPECERAPVDPDITDAERARWDVPPL